MCVPCFSNIPGTNESTFSIKRPDESIVKFVYISFIDNKKKIMTVEPLSSRNKESQDDKVGKIIEKKRMMAGIYTFGEHFIFSFHKNFEKSLENIDSFYVNGTKVSIPEKSAIKENLFMDGINRFYKTYIDVIEKLKEIQKSRVSS